MMIIGRENCLLALAPWLGREIAMRCQLGYIILIWKFFSYFRLTLIYRVSYFTPDMFCCIFFFTHLNVFGLILFASINNNRRMGAIFFLQGGVVLRVGRLSRRNILATL